MYIISNEVCYFTLLCLSCQKVEGIFPHGLMWNLPSSQRMNMFKVVPTFVWLGLAKWKVIVLRANFSGRVHIPCMHQARNEALLSLPSASPVCLSTKWPMIPSPTSLNIVLEEVTPIHPSRFTKASVPPPNWLSLPAPKSNPASEDFHNPQCSSLSQQSHNLW